MSSRVYREACGASGCGFVAGPSRDQNRVMRLADEHRATGHVLEVPAEERRRQVVAGSQAEYRRRQQERAERIVAHLATYRRFDEAATPLSIATPAEDRAVEAAMAARDAARRTARESRAATARRRAGQRARLAELSSAMWSQAG